MQSYKTVPRAKSLYGHYSQISNVERMMPNGSAIKRNKTSFSQAAVQAAAMITGRRKY